MRKSPRGGRRKLILGGLSLATLGAVGVSWKHRRSAQARVESVTPGDLKEAQSTLLAFVSTLFGHELTAADSADLSARFEVLLSDVVLASDCAVLVRVLGEAAKHLGASAFELCSSYQQDSIVSKIMDMDEKSKLSRMWSRFSMDERDTFRMRRSAIPQLAWLYRHSSVAWRTRGYARWAGVAGNWREVLVPGAAYP